MNKTIEIQNEFEILISELERLKSINQLTTTNAETAQSILLDYKKVLTKFDSYKSKVNDILLDNNKNIEKTTKAFIKQVEELGVDSKNHYEELSSTTNNHFQNLEQNIKKYHNDLINIYSETKKSTDALNATNSTLIKQEFEKVKETIERSINSSQKLVEYISSLKIAQRIEKITKQLDSNQSISKQYFEELKKQTTKLYSHFQKNEETSNTNYIKIDNKFKDIINNLTSLKKDIQEQKKDFDVSIKNENHKITDLIEQNKKLNRRILIFQITSSIITIGLVIALFLK